MPTAERKVAFKAVIEETVDTIMRDHEPRYVKGEYFGFFMNYVIKRFVHATGSELPSFNSTLFNEPKRSALTRLASKVSSMIYGGDYLEGADELRYVITAILQGIQGGPGGSSAVEPGDYGFKMYIEGMLEQIRDELAGATFNNSDTKQRIMNFRGLLITKRVIRDVLDGRSWGTCWLSGTLTD
jgi:hypothetical protein